MSDRNVKAAIHEAAHAVVAWRVGYPVTWVELNEDGGSTSHKPGFDPLKLGIVDLAGHAADCKWHGVNKHHIPVDDHWSVTALGFRDRSYTTILSMARAMVEENADEIETVSRWLIERDVYEDDLGGLLGPCDVADDCARTRWQALRLVVWRWLSRALVSPMHGCHTEEGTRM